MHTTSLAAQHSLCLRIRLELHCCWTSATPVALPNSCALRLALGRSCIVQASYFDKLDMHGLEARLEYYGKKIAKLREYSTNP